MTAKLGGSGGQKVEYLGKDDVERAVIAGRRAWR